MVPRLWWGVYYCLQNIRIHLLFDPPISVPVIYPAIAPWQIKKCMYTNFFIAQLFSVMKYWRHHKCPSTEECLSELCTAKYYTQKNTWNGENVLNCDRVISRIYCQVKKTKQNRTKKTRLKGFKSLHWI